jgi:hypothetical protein
VKSHKTGGLGAASLNQVISSSFVEKRPDSCKKKAVLCGLLRLFAPQMASVSQQAQKLCKFAKKVIAPNGFDDYYKQFSCKD